MKKVIVLTTCLAVMFAPTARAAGVDDADDTSGRLDIKYTGAHIEGSRLEFEVEMFRQWPNRLFRDTPTSYGSKFPRGHISVFFNTRGDGRAEWVLLLERSGGEWAAKTCPVVRGNDENQENGASSESGANSSIYCETAKAWRSEADSIEFSITPDQILEGNDSSYVWRARSKLFFGNGCPDTGKNYCKDQARGKQAD